MHYTTCCKTQSVDPVDGQNNCPKHVELIGIINKLLLLRLVGCLYYLYKIRYIYHQSAITIYKTKYFVFRTLLEDFYLHVLVNKIEKISGPLPKDLKNITL
jgi:hypothetical protein